MKVCVDYGNIQRVAMYKRPGGEAVITFFNKDYQRLASVEFVTSSLMQACSELVENRFEMVCLEGKSLCIAFDNDKQKKHFLMLVNMLLEGKEAQVWNLEVAL